MRHILHERAAMANKTAFWKNCFICSGNRTSETTLKNKINVKADHLDA